MVQMLTRGTTSTAPTGVVTVADLLSRYAPAPVVDPEPVTVPVSVGSLLRREGRAPHSLDRPLQPRANQVRSGQAAEPGRADDEYEDDESGARRGPGMLVRRGAIAAGVLVAAGSVFGAAVVDDASSRSGTGAQAEGGYPGQGRLDPTPDEAVPTVVDPAGLAALSEALDPGEAPSASWMEMARGGSADVVPAGPTTGGGTQEQGDVVPLSADADDDEPAGGSSGGGNGGGSPTGDGGSGQGGSGQGGSGQGGSGQGGGNGGGSDDPTPATTTPAPTGGLGGAVQGVGGAVPGPVGGAVEGVGGAVGGLGDGVQTATGGDEQDPGLVGNVGRLAGSLL